MIGGYVRYFDSLKEAIEGLNNVSTSVGQSLGIRFFDHEEHQQMFPDSESDDNPGYGNLIAWKTREGWTTEEVAKELYNNYYGDCMRSAQNLKLSLTKDKQVVIDVDVSTTKVAYGIKPVNFHQSDTYKYVSYEVYIVVDEDAKTIPAKCEESCS